MGSFSLTHLLLLLVIVLLFFGPSRLPNLGQSLGRAIRGFKDGLNGQDEESQNSTRSVGSNSPEQLPPSQQPGGQNATTTQNQKDPQSRS
ncbi:MAG: twin-arginine translocase TatA/TatE family subunit [Bdellovibrionaceae bacterium]|nr:twin-arginine translocase TatA/TatE family subunit [Pseudobdellovibrionaceae bacterium]MBX3032341.1 twin-arginine translocase TatA/TatE family subunit [Pseudobdellovibrionaceae bacterium]